MKQLAEKAPFSFRNIRLSTRVFLLLALGMCALMVALLSLAVSLYKRDKLAYVIDMTDYKSEKLVANLSSKISSISFPNAIKVPLSEIETNFMNYSIPRVPDAGEVFIGQKDKVFYAIRLHADKQSVLLQKITKEELKAFFDDVTARSPGQGEVHYWLTSFGTFLGANRELSESTKDLVKRPVISQYLKSGSQTGFVNNEVEGLQELSSYRDVPGTNTTYFIESPLNEIMRPLRKFIAIAIFTGFSLILFGLLISYTVLRSMWKPVAAIGQMTEQIANGHYDVGFDYSYNDEMSLIFNHISRMAQKLKQREQLIREQESHLRDEHAARVRFEADLETAQAVQNSLIRNVKELADTPEVDVGAYYRSANKAGGDWYGFFADSKKEYLYFFMADVTGHGAASALLTAVTSGVVYGTSIYSENVDNGQGVITLSAMDKLLLIYKSINEVIIQTGRKQYLMTMALCALELKTGKLSYVNAGHTTPYLLHYSPQRESGLPSATDLLGLSNKPSVEENLLVKTIQLEQNDILLLYTDGIVENTGETGQRLANRTMRKMLTKSKDRSAEQIAREISSTAEGIWGDREIVDDASLFLLKYKGPK